MPRPILWQNRLREIERSVSESARTPYARADLESLFRVKERKAQMLLGLMRRHTVGRDSVVEREDLLTFLRGAAEAADLSAHLAALRANPPKPVRRKLRIFQPSDFDRIDVVRSLRKHEVFVERNSVEILFSTLDDFASKLMLLINSIEDADFEKLYCDPPPVKPSIDRTEKLLVDAQTHFLHRIRCVQMAISQDNPELAATFRQEAAQAMAEVRRLSAAIGGTAGETLERYEADMQSAFTQLESAAAHRADAPEFPQPEPES